MSIEPLVSVVIPCRNEYKYIGACLDSLLGSDFPREDFEVLVCDGLSDDGTIAVLKDYAAAHPQIIHLENTKKTTPFALNLGAIAARGTIIIILGAHAEVDKSYLRLCYEGLKQEPHTGCIGGILENIYEDKRSQAIALAMSSPFGVGNAHFRTGAKDGFVDTVAFGAYKKEVFEKIGYFDEDLVRNQDDEFNYRVTKAGFKIRLDRRIRARYYVRARFDKLFRQYFQYGYWKVFVNRKHKAVTTFRQLIPPAFVVFLIAGAAISFIFPVVSPVFIAIIALYVIGSIVSAVRISVSIKQVPLICYTFYLLHLSYGLGYLEGIFHFGILNRRPVPSRSSSSREDRPRG